MKQCEICENKKLCEENHWCITMDNGFKFEVWDEWMCDNFLAYDKSMIIFRGEDDGKGIKNKNGIFKTDS